MLYTLFFKVCDSKDDLETVFSLAVSIANLPARGDLSSLPVRERGWAFYHRKP